MKLLIEYILNCIKKEKEIETLRQSLAANPHFRFYTSFTRFDRDNNSSISAQEFVDFLFFNNSYSPATKETLMITIDFFDDNKDGSITIDEYADFILPKRNSVLRETQLKKDSKALSPGSFLREDIELAIAKLILSECGFQDYCNGMRTTLMSSKTNYWEVFTTLDKDKNGFIKSADIYSFLNSSVEVSKEDCEIFTYKFGKKGKIDFTSYLFFILPCQLVSEFDVELVGMLEKCYRKHYKEKALKCYEKERRLKQKLVSIEEPKKNEPPVVEQGKETKLAMTEEIFDFATVLGRLSLIKSELYLKEDINLYKIFYLFDSDGNNVVTEEEFLDGFVTLDIQAERGLLRRIFWRINKQNHSVLRVSDFKRLFSGVMACNHSLFKSRSETEGAFEERSDLIYVFD